MLGNALNWCSLAISQQTTVAYSNTNSTIYMNLNYKKKNLNSPIQSETVTSVLMDDFIISNPSRNSGSSVDL